MTKRKVVLSKGIVLLSLLGCSILAAFLVSDTYLRKREFVETVDLTPVLSEQLTEKTVLVFFKPGCPYCEAGKEAVLKATKKTEFPVYFVNAASEKGKAIVGKYQVERAATLIFVDSTSTKQVLYAKKETIQGVDHYLPDEKAIRQIFQLENTNN